MTVRGHAQSVLRSTACVRRRHHRGAPAARQWHARTVTSRAGAPLVLIEPWTDADLELLHQLNAPEMTRHNGGPATEEQVGRRHRAYLEPGTPRGRMFRIVVLPGHEAVGSIGFWEHRWHGQLVYETGWNVLPSYQGRGIATAAATTTIAQARKDGEHRYMHAFPPVDNLASNAICRRTGFSLIGPCDFEYPPGNMLRCNDWRLDLRAEPDR
jgi:RimJ/RimL family protein N-acetyltransferase